LGVLKIRPGMGESRLGGRAGTNGFLKKLLEGYRSDFGSSLVQKKAKQSDGKEKQSTFFTGQKYEEK
jgi:hypothetical protein